MSLSDCLFSKMCLQVDMYFLVVPYALVCVCVYASFFVKTTQTVENYLG